MKQARDGVESGEDGEKADRQFVTALARGLEILRCFSSMRPELGTVDIAKLTGLPQPTVWRLCHTLLKLGYLAPAVAGDKLRIGMGVLSLGYSAMSAIDVGEVAQQGMQQLADEFHVASSIAVADRLDMVIVRRATAADAVLVVNVHVGSRLDMATSSFGWAYVAGLPQDQRAALFKDLKKRHGAEWPEMAKRLQGACDNYEKKGYIVNSGFYNKGVNAIAVPIVQAGGQVMALNVGGPSLHLSVKDLEREVAPRLMRLAGVIGVALQQAERNPAPQRAPF